MGWRGWAIVDAAGTGLLSIRLGIGYPFQMCIYKTRADAENALSRQDFGEPVEIVEIDADAIVSREEPPKPAPTRDRYQRDEVV